MVYLAFSAQLSGWISGAWSSVLTRNLSKLWTTSPSDIFPRRSRLFVPQNNKTIAIWSQFLFVAFCLLFCRYVELHHDVHHVHRLVKTEKNIVFLFGCVFVHAIHSICVSLTLCALSRWLMKRFVLIESCDNKMFSVLPSRCLEECTFQNTGIDQPQILMWR